VDRHRTLLDLLEGLVHEGAHQLLFALSHHEGLVENAIDERFESPLRRDPRPMDGVFHATFVCARLHYAYRCLALLPASALPQGARPIIDRKLEDQCMHFRSGCATVRAHARLTATGTLILGDAESYMRAAA